MYEELYNNLERRVCSQIGTAISDFVIKDRLTFFGYFLQNVNFYKSKHIPTAGVNFRNMTMNFYYNEEFVSQLNSKQVKFLCLHELFHLLFNHPKRGHGYVHRMANFAMDMIINDIIIEKYCKEIVTKDNEIIKNSIAEFIPGGVLMDSHYDGEKIFELLYSWTNEKYLLWKSIYGESVKTEIIDNLLKPNNKDILSSVKKITKKRHKENEELGIDELTRRFFENDFPSFDEHFWDDIPDDIKRDIVQRNISNLKGIGVNPGESEEILNRLIKKSNNDFIKILKRNVSSLKGFSKISSFRKPNRRELEGVKGKIKKSNVINCILDTSGSMMGSFEFVLSEIFKDEYIINLVQCDAEVKDFVSINNKNKLQKMKIKGLGGTELQPGINYVINKKEIKNNNLVILTDGWTDTLDFSKYNGIKVLILTSEKKCKLSKDYKNVTQIVVPKK